MKPGLIRRGWCPGLYEPMPTGDGLLVRVKPPGGRLSSAAARTVAEQSTQCGNGIIELTSRANLQIRGLSPATAPRFAAAMAAAGLASADPAAERRRNVMATPLAGDDPSAAADAPALAAAIEAMLAATPALAALPAKFGFAVDGGGVLPLGELADITVRTDGRRHWIGQTPCAPRDTVGLVRDLALAGAPGLRNSPQASAAGFVLYTGSTRGAFAIGLPFGQTDAATLRALADLADRYGDGLLRCSPWRAVLLGGVAEADAPLLRDAAAATGLIADPADRRLRMAACIGSAGCASGTVPARRDAAALVAGKWTGFLHVSGCAKGCAHPHAAPATLVGESGAYGLVRDGRADAPPSLRGLLLRQIAPHL